MVPLLLKPLYPFKRSAQILPKKLLKKLDSTIDRIDSDSTQAKQILICLQLAQKTLGESPHNIWAKSLQIDKVQADLDKMRETLRAMNPEEGETTSFHGNYKG